MNSPFRKFTAALTIIMVWFALTLTVSCEKGERNSVTSRQIVPEQIDGWQLQPEVRSFDRRTIFDYIDGAGEVYLSFAFRGVNVYSYRREGAPEITAEIFDMSVPEDAYGVFSYARESEEPGIGQAFEYRGSVLCFWQDRYYVCVTCYEQTDETSEILPALAREISKRLPDEGKRLDLVNILPEEGKLLHSERFFHLHSSLNYHFFIARENLLNMSPDTRAALARYSPGSACLLCVQYPDAEQAGAAYRSFVEGYLPEFEGAAPVRIEDGKWAAAEVNDRYVTAVFEVATESQARQFLEQIKANLTAFIR